MHGRKPSRHFGRHIPFDKVRNQIGKASEKLIADARQARSFPGRMARGDRVSQESVCRSKYLPDLKAFPCVRELFQHVRDSGRKTALATSAWAKNSSVIWS